MTVTTIKKIEETIINKALNTNCAYECTHYEQYNDYYALCLLCDSQWVDPLYKKLKDFLHKLNLEEFFTADYGYMNEDWDNAKMVCVYFNNAVYPNQIPEIIKIAGKALGLEVEDKPLQGRHMLTTHVDFNTGVVTENAECIVDDYGKYDDDLYTVRFVNRGIIECKGADELKFISKKRKFNLPEGLTWDTRNTVLNKQTWFNPTLIKGGKTTSTKTKTVKAGMEAIAKNRVEEGIWTQAKADEYLKTYNERMELGWTVAFAKYFAKEGPRVHRNIVTSALSTVASAVKSVLPNTTKNTSTGDHESWRIIPSFPDHEASDWGRIRNAATKEILKPMTWISDPYLRVNIHGHIPAVHRLVAEAWCWNCRPSEYTIVDHIDNDVTNNEVSNLRWVSHSMNVKAATLRGATRKKKFTKEVADEIRKRHLFGESIGNLSHAYGVKSGQISPIIHNKTYKDPNWFQYKVDEIFKRLVSFELFDRLYLHDDTISNEALVFKVFATANTILESLKFEMKKWDIKVKLKYNKIDDHEYECAIK